MSKLSRGQLGQLLGVGRREVERLTQAGLIERPDTAGFYESTDTNIAALLAKTPVQRRAAGVPDNRGLDFNDTGLTGQAQE